ELSLLRGTGAQFELGQLESKCTECKRLVCKRVPRLPTENAVHFPRRALRWQLHPRFCQLASWRSPGEFFMAAEENRSPRSQRSFKELIDSFDDVACAVSLDGTLRTVNRRLSDLLRVPYAEIVNHKFDEFCETPVRGEIEAGLGRFLERRRWSGVVPVKLKNS